MVRGPKRVPLRPDTDLLHLVEEVHRDKEPRLIERDGEVLAVVVSPEEYSSSSAPKSKRFKKELLALAGVWKDLDADRMIDDIYKARHEAPPSPPAEL